MGYFLKTFTRADPRANVHLLTSFSVRDICAKEL